MLIESFSGIRGVYNTDLTQEITKNYAAAFLTLLKQVNPSPQVVISMDPRPSSKEIKATLAKIIPNIIDIGTLPVAAAQSAVRNFKATAGIMITASHNEPEFNGFKFLSNEGSILHPNDMKQLIELSKDQHPKEISPVIHDEHESALTSYISHIQDHLNLDIIKSFKGTILVDPNGGCGIHLKEIAQHFELNCFNFINDEQGQFRRTIEPNKESLEPLQEHIQNNNFLAGLDCDADRVEILLKDATVVNGNHLLAIIADDMLTENSTIITNDATSQVVRDIAQKHKAHHIEVEVGEINVVEAMKKHQAILGGEGSNGGIILPPATSRDGITTLLKLIEILAKNNTTLENLIEKIPNYYTLQEKVTNEHPIQLKDKLKKHWKSHPIKETGDLSGGLKIHINENTFLWARASKTEANLLRIIVDSDDEEHAKRILEEAMQVIKE
ncbi:MAG: hypothetical protein O2779_01650 [Nanoarchaeota archaeon]|nr:hypothetical protein [Nanoarchaeota archaeon]